MDLGLHGQATYTPFVVVGRSRVGSNLLRGLLNAHPQIATFGEVFRSMDSLDWDHVGYFQSRETKILIEQDPVRFLDRRVFGRYPRATRAVGFKLFYYHARTGAAASIWPYLRERRDLKVVHLKRRNLLRTHLSRKRAALTDQWVKTTGQPDGSVVVTLDFDECLKDFAQTRTWELECDEYFAAHTRREVTYEALAGDYGTEIQSLHEFLGVPFQPAKPSTFKQAKQPLSAMIANYPELKERFTGTGWAEFFTE